MLQLARTSGCNRRCLGRMRREPVGEMCVRRQPVVPEVLIDSALSGLLAVKECASGEPRFVGLDLVATVHQLGGLRR